MAETFSMSFLLKLVDNLSSPLQKVGQAFDEIDKKFSQASGAAMKMGAKMSAFATAPIMAWAGYAAHEAGKVHIAFREMNQALEDLPKGQLSGLEDDLRTMSTTMPRSTVELAEYAKMAGKMNELGDVRGFTKFMAQFTVANEDMRENTGSFMDMARAIGLTQGEYAHMGDVITLLSKRFNTSASSMVQNALDIGGSLEAPKDQIMVLAAYMDTFGAASQPIRRLLDSMQQAAIGKNPLNAEIMAKAGGYGLDVGKFQSEFAKNPAVVLQKLLAGFGDLKGKDLYTLRAIFDQVGLGGQRTIGVINKAVQSLPELSRMLQLVADQQKVNGAMSKEAEEKTGDFNNQMVMLKNTFNDFAVQFGADIKPVMTWLVNKAKNLLSVFRGLPSWLRYTIEGFLGIVAAIGPMLMGLAVLKGSLAVLGIASAPALALAAALAAVGVALYEIVKNWQTLTAGGFVETMKDFGKFSVYLMSGGRYFNPDVPSGAGGVMSSKGQADIRIELDNGLKIGGVKNQGKMQTEVNTPGYAGLKFAY